MRLSLYCLFILFIIGCQPGNDQASVHTLSEIVSPLYDEKDKPFYHGVASGDPLDDRVIIWTRVTPERALSSVEAGWEVADNKQFQPVLKSGSTNTSPEKDYTLKIDVDGLQPDKYYYYRFTALDKTSPIGRTKTLPRGDVDSLKFAVVSCSNWQHGYFNAYERIADRTLDVVLHLGDYIYEYGPGNARVQDRTHLPEHEIVTLADYRTRYSQYHLDPGLKRMRQQHPLITIWDDHEVANNTYIEGAQNHQPDQEGEFQQRVAAARKAYYEWIPIRDKDKHYRSFTFGNMAEVLMLDERLEGKTKPAESVEDPIYALEDRSMLGEAQLSWLESRMKTTSARWKVVGNQVIFSDLDRESVTPDNPRNMDSWDGYPMEKKRVAGLIRDNDVKNVIFLTGDTHSSWAFEVVADPLTKPLANYQPFAVEFGTTSISSSNSNESMDDEKVIAMEAAYLKANPHLKFVNRRDHGYLLLTLYPERAKAEWYFVGTIQKPDSSEKLARTIFTDLNSNRLR